MYDIKRQKLKGSETQTVHHDISELSVKEARAKVPKNHKDICFLHWHKWQIICVEIFEIFANS